MSLNHSLIIATLAILVAGILAFLQGTSPTSACVDLQPGRGDAAWFYQTCSSPQPNAAGKWNITLDPAKSGQKSLSIRVENTYPGYRLECDLYFANSGGLPFAVKNITITNPNPRILTLSAVEGPAKSGKIVRPCGFTPAWGLNPSKVPAACRSQIHLSLTLGQNVPENSRLPFNVQVKLDEKK